MPVPARRGGEGRASRTWVTHLPAHATELRLIDEDGEARCSLAAELETTAAGVITDVNAAARSLLAVEDVVGLPITSLVHWEDVGYVEAALSAVERHGRHLGEVRFEIGADWGTALVAVVPGVQGGWRWLLAPVGPVGDHLARCVDNVPGALYTCLPDDGWTCSFISDGIARISGFEGREWVADPQLWLSMIAPDDRERLVLARLEAMASQARLSLEYRLVTASGEERWVHDEARMEVEDGVVVAIHGILTDATSHRRSESVLAHLYDEAQARIASLKAREQERATFARVLAHDIRTPLTVASGVIDTLGRTGMELTEEQRTELLRRATEALHGGLDLIRDVLEAERWAGLSGPLLPRTVDLREILDRVVRGLGVEEMVVLECEPGTQVRIDPVVVGRAVANLVDNAVGYSEDGLPVSVRVWHGRTEREIVVSVEDRGPGVPDEHKERIFDPFRRVAVGGRDGFGLGLSLVRTLATIHGGRVWVEDLPGGGSVFQLLVREA